MCLLGQWPTEKIQERAHFHSYKKLHTTSIAATAVSVCMALSTLFLKGTYNVRVLEWWNLSTVS